MGLSAEGSRSSPPTTAATVCCWPPKSPSTVVICTTSCCPASTATKWFAGCAPQVWTPVLMLTAKDGDYDQADAFEPRRTSYLAKPFAIRCAHRRLRACCAAGLTTPDRADGRGSIAGSARKTVQRGDTPIHADPAGVRAAGVLHAQYGHGCRPKAAILQHVWDAHCDGRTMSSRCMWTICGARSTPVRDRHHRDGARGGLPAGFRAGR